jgi:hypothetical protein
MTFWSFEGWYKHVTRLPISTFLEENLPPNDVLMVWHTYLLNPGWFSEDCARIPALQNIYYLSSIFAEPIVSTAAFSTIFPPTSH